MERKNPFEYQFATEVLQEIIDEFDTYRIKLSDSLASEQQSLNDVSIISDMKNIHDKLIKFKMKL